LTKRDRYEIRFDPYARKALGKIDKVDRRRVLARIERLADDPRPPGAALLKGRRGDWRIRAGDHRVIYTIQDDVLLVLVIEVGHRSSIYR
jgi:mRNA interferase RelE/StbE